MAGGKGLAAAKRPTHEKLGVQARSLGKTIRGRFKRSGFGKYEMRRPGHKTDALSELVRSRKIEAKLTNRFGDWWRGLLEANDELFSTSTVREVLRGFFEEESTGPLTADELASLENLLKQLSDARIPTRYSGFATRGGKMQHPTGGEPFFGRPGEAHGGADRERREYVLRAMDDAAEEEAADAVKIAQAGLRAAIEYTLNNFTAPVTARNVFKHSQRGSHPRFDPDHLEQVRLRELMKDLYEGAGGELPAARRGETARESVIRRWPGRREGDELPDEAPPSPRRRLTELTADDLADVTDYSSDIEDSELSAAAEKEEIPGDEMMDVTAPGLEMSDASEEGSIESVSSLTDLVRTAAGDPDLAFMEFGGAGVMEGAGDAAAGAAGVVGALEGAVETLGEAAAVVVALV